MFIARHWQLTPIILATWEAEIWRVAVQRPAQANSSGDSISKMTRAEWTGGVAQVVEYLLCTYKALSSNSSPTKKKKKNVHSNFIYNIQTLEAATN
jgi:hypothetical protein